MKAFHALASERFGTVRRFAAQSAGEQEYYDAILDGRQRGKVFVDDAEHPAAVLFWHYAGFAFVAGAANDTFLDNVLSMLRQEHPYFTQDTLLQKRFLLQQDDPTAEKRFETAAGLARSERLCFAMADGEARKSTLPEGYALKAVDAVLLCAMHGSVTPAFSWSSAEEFLRGGCACCVMHGTEPAAWAFSAAIGGGRMDVGVETAEPYRGKGLARAAAAAMANAALRMGLRPVWGCDAANLASARTAESAGFAFSGRHAKFKKAAR